MDNKKTDILNSDEFESKRKVLGHVDENNKIRKVDGMFSKGKEMGYVDDNGSVREKDGFFTKGKELGKIEENKALGNDGFFKKGEEHGYIDDEGNIRQRDGIFSKGKIIGKAIGENKTNSLGFFILQFGELEKEVEQFSYEVKVSSNKCNFYNRLKCLRDKVINYKAIGDFDKLITIINGLEYEIEYEFQQNYNEKRQVIYEAKELCTSTEWKDTSKKFEELYEEWKKIGPVKKELSEDLWNEFSNYKNQFYENKNKFFENLKIEQSNNARKKELLIDEIRSLAYSSDWKIASKRVNEIVDEFEKVGFAGKENNAKIWNRYKETKELFYTNKKEYYDRRNVEIKAKKRDSLMKTIDDKIRCRDKHEKDIIRKEGVINNIEAKIDNLTSGPYTEEFKSNYESRIEDIENEISDLREKISKLTDHIHELKREFDDL